MSEQTTTERLRDYTARRDDALARFDQAALLALLREYGTPVPEIDWEAVMHIARSGCRRVDPALRAESIAWLDARTLPNLADDGLDEAGDAMERFDRNAQFVATAMDVVFQPDLWTAYTGNP